MTLGDILTIFLTTVVLGVFFISFVIDVFFADQDKAEPWI